MNNSFLSLQPKYKKIGPNCLQNALDDPHYKNCLEACVGIKDGTLENLKPFSPFEIKAITAAERGRKRGSAAGFGFLCKLLGGGLL